MPEAGIFYANESGTAEVQAFVSFYKRRKLFLLSGPLGPIPKTTEKTEERTYETHQDL